MSGRAPSHPRKLFWRYKGWFAARSPRRRIAGNEFLCDVVQDPRERANLKDREKAIFDRLEGDWEAWSGTMLPERARPATYFNTGNLLADTTGSTR